MSSPFRYRDASPDQVREQVQRNVAKGVAAVGGFFAGLREGMERGQVAQEARNLGETIVTSVREAAAGARDEFRRQPPRDEM